MNLDRILPPVAPVLRQALRPFKARRRAALRAAPGRPGDAVFLGDSITAMGHWAELFPGLSTTNQGVNGETISEVATRLDAAIDHPAVVSLLIGTNDLHGLGPSKEPAVIADQLEDLVQRIRQMAPEAPLLLNSVLPRSTLFKDRIQQLNQRYADIAAQTGSTWIDLWPATADSDGAIRRELTRDGIHLNAEGYEVWADVLRPHLA